MKKEAKTEHLTVDFYEVGGGWLFFKLTIGEHTFDNRFSYVFDPLPDLKHWLEAISIGVQQTSFIYDNERTHIKFDFEWKGWHREVLTISDTLEDGQVLIQENINSRQIVKAFYLGLLTFASSDKFSSREWEVEYYKERLCEILNIDEETLIEQLTELDRNELVEILFKADPLYLVSFPEATDKNEEWDMFIQDTVDKENKVSNELKRVETPIKWGVPDGYNFWTTDKKREYVIDSINRPTSGFDGTKINDFRSSIIEKYLDEE